MSYQPAIANLEGIRLQAIFYSCQEASHGASVAGDTGPGISPEFQNRIFDLFFTTKKGGTGLGLAMASQCIKSLGGMITMDNNGGGGEFRTTFEIALPLAV